MYTYIIKNLRNYNKVNYNSDKWEMEIFHQITYTNNGVNIKVIVISCLIWLKINN